MFAGLDVKSDETGQPLPQGEQSYIQFGVPWLKDDPGFWGTYKLNLR